MKDLLDALLDIVAVIFGETPERNPRPGGRPRYRRRPPGLPPPAPRRPLPDPNEPQDGASLDAADQIVVAHEAEPPPEEERPEFDDDPVPPPEDVAGDTSDTTPGSGGDEPVTPLQPVEVPQIEVPVIIPDLPRPNTPVPPAPEYRARYLWCIDNGHGALSPGKRSPEYAPGRRLLEYEFNRDISARIFRRLDVIGVSYYNVVPEVEVGNLLKERVARVNSLSSSLPKLYLSIHGNAGPAPNIDSYTDDSARGIETWYYHGSTKGRKLAAVFQKHLIQQTGLPNRHLRSKVSGQFYVLRATRMPAVLTENGFYNNRLDLPIMLTDGFRRRVAEAHVRAILEVEATGL